MDINDCSGGGIIQEKLSPGGHDAGMTVLSRFLRSLPAALPVLGCVALCNLLLAVCMVFSIYPQPLGMPLPENQFAMRDFLAFYAAGHAVLKGEAAAAYSTASMLALQSEVAQYPLMHSLGGVMNPPPALLLLALFAALPPGAAYAAWIAAGTAAVALSAGGCGRSGDGAPETRWRVLCIASCPFMIVWLVQGQMTAFLLASALGFWHAARRRQTGPAVAFLCLSMLKPPFFLLLLALAARMRWWRAAAGAATVALTAAALTTALLGAEVWQAFWAQAADRVNDPAASGSSLLAMCNLRALLLRLSGGEGFRAIQLFSAAAYAAWLLLAARPWRAGKEIDARSWGGLLLGGVFLSPWLHAHDLWLCAPAAYFLTREARSLRPALAYLTLLTGALLAVGALPPQILAWTYQAGLAALWAAGGYRR